MADAVVDQPVNPDRQAADLPQVEFAEDNIRGILKTLTQELFIIRQIRTDVQEFVRIWHLLRASIVPFFRSATITDKTCSFPEKPTYPYFAPFGSAFCRELLVRIPNLTSWNHAGDRLLLWCHSTLQKKWAPAGAHRIELFPYLPAFSSFFRSFPVAFRGNSVLNSTISGILYLAILSLR